MRDTNTTLHTFPCLSNLTIGLVVPGGNNTVVPGLSFFGDPGGIGSLSNDKLKQQLQCVPKFPKWTGASCLILIFLFLG